MERKDVGGAWRPVRSRRGKLTKCRVLREARPPDSAQDSGWTDGRSKCRKKEGKDWFFLFSVSLAHFLSVSCEVIERARERQKEEEEEEER